MPDDLADRLALSMQPRTYTLHTNVDRTILLTTEGTGTITIAFRDHPSATWGPPIVLESA
jgi:hypothetical protein